MISLLQTKWGILKKLKKQKRTQKRTQKRVGLGEPETEQFKNELKKKTKMNSRKKQKPKKKTTHVSLMLGRCVTSAWEMTRFQRGHLMFKIPPGRDLFCGVKFCWLCPGQRLRNRTSSASSFRSTPSMKLKLCVHRAPIPNPSPKHLCSRSCFGLRL